MGKIRKIKYAFVLTLIALFAASPAWATDELDLSVGFKVIPLLTNKIFGKVTVAIIYDPGNPESKAEAMNINKIMAGNYEAPGDIQLSPLLVPVNDLSKLSSAKIGIVTKGSCTDAVSTAAANNGILTMTSDLDCVKANRCILGIVSRPNVEIYLSRSAADAARLGFSQAFIMLAKEVG